MSAVAAAKVVALQPKETPRPAGLLPWEDEQAFASVRTSFLDAMSRRGQQRHRLSSGWLGANGAERD